MTRSDGYGRGATVGLERVAYLKSSWIDRTLYVLSK